MNDVVMVVDDDDGVRTGLEVSLSANGYDVVTARGGTEALGLLRSQRPDLVLLDYAMPDLTGLEVLEKIRSENIGDAPVLMITGYAYGAQIEKAIDLGAVDVVQKPFEIPQLLSLVRRTIDKSKGVPDRGKSSTGDGVSVEQDEVIGTNEAAKLLGLHPSSVQRWLDSGQIPSFRTPGGHRRVKMTDLRRYIDSRRKPSR